MLFKKFELMLTKVQISQSYIFTTQVITLDFLIVPLVLTVGGILTLLISIFGLVAVAREVS